MLGTVLRSLAFGLIGLAAAPVLVFFLVLLVGYAFDSRCGTPGDSGGCEMGAAALAIAAALPGFAVGVIVALVRGARRISS